jgi:hypothetical protein
VQKDAKEGSEPETWGIELTSPGNLQGAGITGRALNPAELVSVIMSPLQSANTGALLDQLKIEPPECHTTKVTV